MKFIIGDWKLEIGNWKSLVVLFTIALLLSGCTISYKFNGSNIDYTKTKTISIAEFTNTAELVYAPLTQQFSEKLRDVYTRNTRLQVLKKGGDMHLEGEITEYYLTPMAISADTYASQTKLTVTVNVRFTNSKNPDDDFEKKYSAYQTFDSSQMINDVQDDLLKTIIEEISDNIYNETVAKW
jgi:hypothetical protein